VSRPSYWTIRDKSESSELSHIYELRNQGPSPLPEADLMVEYPQVQFNGQVYLKLNTTKVGHSVLLMLALYNLSVLKSWKTWIHI